MKMLVCAFVVLRTQDKAVYAVSGKPAGSEIHSMEVIDSAKHIVSVCKIQGRGVIEFVDMLDA